MTEFVKKNHGTLLDLFGSMSKFDVSIAEIEHIHGYYDVAIGKAHLGEMRLEEVILLCSRILSRENNSNGAIGILGHLLAEAIKEM